MFPFKFYKCKSLERTMVPRINHVNFMSVSLERKRETKKFKERVKNKVDGDVRPD